jgi:hypothetical protein
MMPTKSFASGRSTAANFRHTNCCAGSINALSGASQENVPPEYLAYVRTAMCDAEGDFAFQGVKAGEFYVLTQILWTVGDSWFPEGGKVAQLVTVSGGQPKTVLLSN